MNKMLTVSALALVTFTTSLAFGGKSTPMDQSHLLVDILQKVVTPAEGQALTAEQVAANNKIYGQLDKLIDFQKLTEGPVKPHKKSLSKKQVKTIKTLFKDAIRNIAYPKSGSFFSGAELT